MNRSGIRKNKRSLARPSLALLVLAATSGCGNFPIPGLVAGITKEETPQETTISGDVATASPDTGLPQTISGKLAGDFVGTYDEDILEVFFDADGSPIAAVSRSVFSLEAPLVGTLTSLNQIVVTDFILPGDEDAQALPIGLRTVASGEILHGTGAYENTTGELRSDSTILFGGGATGLGTLTSLLEITLDQ